ncbi:MAG: 3D domain-containing protein [Candidatus Kerfeldbacteria bacterium]|nr:3D domain-containing protein [Candidatus Kerfeldbacteria bacterium]
MIYTLFQSLTRLSKRVALTSIIALGITLFAAPDTADAYAPRLTTVNVYNIYAGLVPVAALQPVAQLRTPEQVTSTAVYLMTSYTSLPELTDSSPFITANGSHVRMGTIAANCLPFGTRVRIPDLFGDQIFVVEDRLAARKPCSMIDVWLPTYAEAKQFGVKRAKVEILAMK